MSNAQFLASVHRDEKTEAKIAQILWGGEMSTLICGVEFLTEIAEELLDAFDQSENLRDYFAIKEQLESIKKIVNK